MGPLCQTINLISDSALRGDVLAHIRQCRESIHDVNAVGTPLARLAQHSPVKRGRSTSAPGRIDSTFCSASSGSTPSTSRVISPQSVEGNSQQANAHGPTQYVEATESFLQAERQSVKTQMHTE